MPGSEGPPPGPQFAFRRLTTTPLTSQLGRTPQQVTLTPGEGKGGTGAGLGKYPGTALGGGGAVDVSGLSEQGSLLVRSLQERRLRIADSDSSSSSEGISSLPPTPTNENEFSGSGGMRTWAVSACL